jgi:L-rhamnose isomerase
MSAFCGLIIQKGFDMADRIEKGYELAKESYASIGVDTDKAIEKLKGIPISLHCWQGDDVCGFETTEGLSSGGIMATGNYPGRARNIGELRSDYEKALSLIPGKHRVNLHAIYLDDGGKPVDRNKIGPEHFQSWIDWAREHGVGVDFNGTFFAHPMADSGFTLSSRDEGVRKYWVEHGIACRKIGAEIGKQLANPCVTNIWIPDGYKDYPYDRKGPRQILRKSLDEILAEKIEPGHNLDAVESKLFGIGSEAYVVGSHEFYMGYAQHKNVLLCLDAGHFHPTEEISNKISSCLEFIDSLLLHVSRPMRWDSDHVVLLDDQLRSIAQEIVRGDYLDRVHVGLDFFDASINRIAAWVIGTRSMIKALLLALLEPADELAKREAGGDFSYRLAMFENLKSMPFSAVWDYYCKSSGVPVGFDWFDDVRSYEADVTSKRDG